ncbi:MAG: potassium channel protein [Thermovirgaceae bacterium]|nr:potassium channel protein [Thermovirgaceae bacterium]
MKTLSKARYWLMVLLAIFVAGTFGIWYFCDVDLVDALFYTVTTLTTVGYDAPPGLPLGGKVFIIFLILAGIGTAGLAIGEITNYFVVGGLLSAMGKRRDSRVKNLEKHWILVGLGKVGHEVAQHLRKDNMPFMAIDIDESKVVAAREEGWIVHRGDARIDNVLEDAGILKASGMILTLPDDADNVYATITARALNPALRIIARANDPQSVAVLTKAGAEKAINLIEAEAAAIARASIKPSVSNFLELVNISRGLSLDFDSVTVHPESPVVGLPLLSTPLRSRFNAMVIAIKKRNGVITYNPRGDEVLYEGDELILFAELDKMDALKRHVCTPGKA